MQYFLLMIAVVALVVGCGEEPQSPPVVTANIGDPIVEKSIRESLKKPTGELTKADLEKVTRLNLRFNQLTEIPNGLEKLTQLEGLNLYKNQLTDVKGLENLTHLQDLGISYNILTDVRGLEKLTQLTSLNLHHNILTDVKGLEKLTQLRYLDLEYNQLTDVKGLEKLTQLEELWIKDNPDLTKTQIDELQKALPKCTIESNPTK